MIFRVRIPGWLVAVLVVAAFAGAGYWAFRMVNASGPLEVHYPYYCTGCRKVFDVSVLKEDYPAKWRIAPGAESDSVVICPFCNEGRAYPVATCPHCGTRYLLHIAGDGRCPKCHPENAADAEARHVDLTPPELTRY